MTNEAIILAGGLGTRLKGVINDIPKPMAPVGELPFLEYLFKYVSKYQIRRIILAVGYKHEVIEQYFGNEYNGIELVYAIENEPLGTGGAIANALKYCKSETVFLLNGDSYFNVDLNKLHKQHEQSQADLTLSIKQMQNFNRYGTVEFKETKITAFKEKQPTNIGYINGGVYALNKALLLENKLPQKFSFEQDIMEAFVTEKNYQTIISDGYFIDIGIPEDYERAQIELPDLLN